uniref:Uncharacterized protein n=1 Tax=Anguilla anguilla TaxID=7936 RepID=A0A0E9RMD2_ANGAN
MHLLYFGIYLLYFMQWVPLNLITACLDI